MLPPFRFSGFLPLSKAIRCCAALCNTSTPDGGTPLGGVTCIIRVLFLLLCTPTDPYPILNIPSLHLLLSLGSAPDILHVSLCTKPLSGSILHYVALLSLLYLCDSYSIEFSIHGGPYHILPHLVGFLVDISTHISSLYEQHKHSIGGLIYTKYFD